MKFALPKLPMLGLPSIPDVVLPPLPQFPEIKWPTIPTIKLPEVKMKSPPEICILCMLMKLLMIIKTVIEASAPRHTYVPLTQLQQLTTTFEHWWTAPALMSSTAR